MDGRTATPNEAEAQKKREAEKDLTWSDRFHRANIATGCSFVARNNTRNTLVEVDNVQHQFASEWGAFHGILPPSYSMLVTPINVFRLARSQTGS